MRVEERLQSDRRSRNMSREQLQAEIARPQEELSALKQETEWLHLELLKLNEEFMTKMTCADRRVEEVTCTMQEAEERVADLQKRMDDVKL